MSAIRKYMWVKSKKKKGRDILSRINSLQRPIRTTDRCLKVHPSSGQETLSHVQVSSEMSLLLALTWIALGRTMYIPLTSEETYRRVETWQTNGRKEEGRPFPPKPRQHPIPNIRLRHSFISVIVRRPEEGVTIRPTRGI